MQIEMDKLMELGTMLKDKRRGLGLEREEISIKIKVSAKTLHALEEAIIDSLPQPVFARGFARSYAESLGFNMDDVNQIISQAFPADFTGNVNPELSSAAREQSISINQTSNAKLLAVVIPLVLLVLGVAGWFAYKTFFADIDTGPVSSASQQSRPVAGVQEPPRKPDAEAGNAVDTAPAEPDAPVNAPDDAADQQATAQTPPPAQNTQQQAGGSQDISISHVRQSNARADSPIPSGRQRIIVFARGKCWVTANFDDSEGYRDFMLEAGEIFVLDFKKNLVLELGNSGGVEMSYNGQSYKIAGGSVGVPKKLTFPPQ